MKKPSSFSHLRRPPPPLSSKRLLKKLIFWTPSLKQIQIHQNNCQTSWATNYWPFLNLQACMCQISSHVCVFSFWQNMSVKVANLANGKVLCCGEKAEFPLSRAEKNHPTFPRAFIWLVNKFPIVCQLFEDAEYCSIKVWCSRMVASSSLPCHRRLMIKMINEKCSKQDAALHSSLVCMQSLIVMSCLNLIMLNW